MILHAVCGFRVEDDGEHLELIPIMSDPAAVDRYYPERGEPHYHEDDDGEWMPCMLRHKER